MSIICTTLEPFVSLERRNRIEAVLNGRTRNLMLLLEDVNDPHNIDACMRTSEALGLQEVHVLAARNRFSPHHKVTIGADKWLDLHFHKSLEPCIQKLHDRGIKVAAGALSPVAVPIQDLDFTQPWALAFGNEREGLTQGLLDMADTVFQIPMSGFTQSFNISVSAAISTFFAVERRKALLGTSGDLSDEQKMVLRERWYVTSVDMARAILARAGVEYGKAGS